MCVRAVLLFKFTILSFQYVGGRMKKRKRGMIIVTDEKKNGVVQQKREKRF